MKVRGTDETGVYVQHGEHANYFSVKLLNVDGRGGFMTKHVWKLVIDMTQTLAPEDAKMRGSDEYFKRGTHAQQRALEHEVALEWVTTIDLESELREMFEVVQKVDELEYDCEVSNAKYAIKQVNARFPNLRVEDDGDGFITVFL